MSRRMAPEARFSWSTLETVDQVIGDTRKRSESRQNIHMNSVVDLNLRYVEPSSGMPRGGYMARIDGKDLPLGDGAIKTACRLMGAQPKFFQRHADPMAFPQSLRNVLDNPARKGTPGFLVRTGLASNGIREEIAAILNPDYQIKDAYEQVTEFAQMVNDNVGNIRGVSRLEQGHGDIASYRLIIGNNIMPKLNEADGQFMMFCLGMSETGVRPDSTTLGMYRLVCTNGAMAGREFRQLSSEWNHIGSQENHINKASESVRHLGYFGDTWGKIFQELLDIPLQSPAEDVLAALNSSSLIDSGHFDAAELHAKTVGGSINTQFDFYNLLTRSAQDLPSITARERAESKTLKLFAEPGGIMEHLRQAASKRERIQANELPI